jgi:hypothetical protein
VVPEYEIREAALYCGYTLVEFEDIDYEEKCLAVAQYRMHALIESHVSDAIARTPPDGKSTGNSANRRPSRNTRHA